MIDLLTKPLMEWTLLDSLALTAVAIVVVVAVEIWRIRR